MKIYFKKERNKTLKKLLLVSLICLLVFSFAITGLAKVELVYWTFPGIKLEGLQPGEYEQNMIDKFEKEYPEVEIDLQIIPFDGGIKKVELSIISGNPPDILPDNIFRMGKFADAGLLVPFELTEAEKADFFPFAVKACTFNDKMYLWPCAVSQTGMMVSKKIARDAGALDLLPLDRPDRSWTADEYTTFLKKVADAKLPDIRGYLFFFGDANGQQDFVMLMLQGFGAVPFVYENGRHRCTMNSPEAVEGLEYYLDLYNNYPGCYHEGAENLSCFDNGRIISSGKIASWISPIGGLLQGLEGTNEIFADLDISMFPIPSKEGISNSALFSMGAFGVFDNGDAEKAKYAQLFVRYYGENAPNFLTAASNASPVRKSQQIAEAFQKHKDDPDVQFYLTTLAKYGKNYGTTCPVYQQYTEIWRTTMQGVFTGELTAKEGLDEIARKVNKVLDEHYEE